MMNQHESRRSRLAVVLKTQMVSGRIRRVTLKSNDLQGFDASEPAQWVKLFVPTKAGNIVGRAYTIRDYRKASGEIDIDFVVHGDGPAANWSNVAKPGDEVELAGPRSGFTLREDTRHILVAGDETAIPAIQTILSDALDRVYCTVLISAHSPADRQDIPVSPNITTRWLLPDTEAADQKSLLYDAIIGMPQIIRDDIDQVWVAGESSEIARIRKFVLHEMGIAKTSLYASGYWKAGEGDHRDPEGDE